MLEYRDSELESVFNFRVFSTGRRIFALQQVRQVALEMGLADIVEQIDASLAGDTETRELEVSWLRRKEVTRKGTEAQRVGRLLSKTLSSIIGVVENVARGARPDDEIVAEARAFIDALVPAGVVEVTALPFVEALSEYDRINAEISGPLAGTVEAIGPGVSHLTERLARLTNEFRDHLEEPSPEGVTFETVRAARARGQQMMLQTVAMIVGRFCSDSEEQWSARASLLGPILEQNETIGEYLRSHRVVEDVNPETGEIETEPPIETEPEEPASPVEAPEEPASPGAAPG